MISSIIAICALICGAAISSLVHKFKTKPLIKPSYDEDEIAKITKRTDVIIEGIKEKNKEIKDKDEALQELNRYRDDN